MRHFFRKFSVVVVLMILLVPMAAPAYAKSFSVGNSIPRNDKKDFYVNVTTEKKNVKLSFTNKYGCIECKFFDNANKKSGTNNRTHVYASYTITVYELQKGQKWVEVSNQDVYNKKSSSIKLPRAGQYQIKVHVWKPVTIAQSYWNHNVKIGLNLVDQALSGKTFRGKTYNNLNNVTIRSAYWYNTMPSWTISGSTGISKMALASKPVK